jgi:hypothetical protein
MGPVLRVDESRDFSQLDLAAFPLVEGFALKLRDCAMLGYHIDFVDGDGARLAGFPWWDHVEVALKTLDAATIPRGTRAAPFDDLEQGWQIIIFEERGFVYVLEGAEPCCTEFAAWFKVKTADYVAAWSAAIAWARANRRTAGTLEQAFAAKSEVRKLDLRGQHLTELPEEIGELAALEELELAHNDLLTLPLSIGRLTRLKRLEMNFTKVVDFPRAILDLTSLELLAINYTKLREVPEEVGRLERLSILTLCANDLGALPASIFRLPRLEELIATDSHMTSLPPVLGDLPMITSINLSANRLPESEKSRLRARYPKVRVTV